jgi:hemerythrin-like domain-containing protein
MNVVDHLLQDHEEIAAMLHVLTACAARLREGHFVDPPMMQGLDRFVQQFVGDCYFRKQRTVFLPYVREVWPEEAARTHDIAGLRARALGPMRDFHVAVERALAAGVEHMVDEFAHAASRCVERLRPYLEAERPLLDHVRHTTDAGHAPLVAHCAEIERGCFGAAGREWYTQLVTDHVDIARSWTTWPATAGAPLIDSGRHRPATRTEVEPG